MARPRVYDEDRVTTAVRLPQTLHRLLQETASQRDVSVNLLVVRALSHYLEQLAPIDDLDLRQAVG